MVRRKPEEPDVSLPPPAKTLEGREEQLTAAAYNLVERRIANGTASAQETVHFLKVGSTEKIAQLEKLRGENNLLKTRIKELESRTSGESMYAEALQAFKGYAGIEPIDPEGDEYYDEQY